jgi:hypothetical protein
MSVAGRIEADCRANSQPAMSWKTMPEVMIGVIPSSISVPLFDAIIVRSQYSGSEESEDTTTSLLACASLINHSALGATDFRRVVTET